MSRCKDERGPCTSTNILQEEQAQLARRLALMKKEAKKRDKSHEVQIQQLMEQRRHSYRQACKQTFKKTIDDESAQMRKWIKLLQKNKEMRRIRDDHVGQMETIRARLESSNEEQPEVHHHYHNDGCALSSRRSVHSNHCQSDTS
jgi:hypothetical protein